MSNMAVSTPKLRRKCNRYTATLNIKCNPLHIRNTLGRNSNNNSNSNSNTT